ncbi:MAG TPA: TIR domain-containing protein [Nostocaceae cyanobacterium]|nr:TIR domain-containing protein [Nostocaceae cyanobacterium]
MNNFYNAFISYGRADSKAFATNLYQRLGEKGLKVWFDQNDIPLGVDFQNQIDDGITKADNFLFIIAPHSVNSPYCRKEIDLAVQLNKRIIPILHVEQITQSTWQERNPGKDLSEWETYKAKGLHSSFPNMHQAIGKINWVYLREGIDDFEKSFTGLLEIFDRHQEYVHQHTYFLNKALEWEKQEKQSRYLLIGEERQQAESWLKERFQHKQPPCEPTDLHCTFITESIKNVNNLMTQVFLSYADQDREFMEKIAKTLRRESFTVWTNKTDIKSGEEFDKAIERGIEETDNIVYLISTNSLQSEYCQEEISLALSLHKRIIPLLIEDIDPKIIPDNIRSLQYINFIDGKGEEEYQSDVAQLINVLRQDAPYYEQHKIILTKALKWERQKHNPNILLRGYNLRSAQAWLKVAKQKKQHEPIPLQEEFISQSLQKPPESTVDVFIAYSRADSDFVRKLNETLQIQNKTTWFDQESVASGSDFQQEINRGIESANNFLFIISPHSLTSPYSLPQLDYAIKLNKRIVPVLYRQVDAATLPPALAKVQLIDFNSNGGDFLSNFGELTRTLDTDPEYMRSHTRLLLKAKEWEQQGRDESFLLRGKDLAESEKWLNQAQKKEPALTNLQLEYIAASRALPHKKIKPRSLLLGSLAVTFVIFFAKLLGWTDLIELTTYDRLLQSRGIEPKDKRFLIVEIDQESIQWLEDKENDSELKSQNQGNSRTPQTQEEGRGIIKYSELNNLIEQISQYKPKIIGITFPVDLSTKKLGEYLPTYNEPNLIFQCPRFSQHLKGNKRQDWIPKERIGSVSVIDDDPNLGRFLRRDTLLKIPNSQENPESNSKSCDVKLSFSLLISTKYLKAIQGDKYKDNFHRVKDGKYTDELTNLQSIEKLQIGDITIPRLKGIIVGGYHNVNKKSLLYETMLNYRISGTQKIEDRDGKIHIYRSPNMFAEKRTLKSLLTENNDKESLIKDKIVLIGETIVESDSYYTPYGNFPVPIVNIQGQMISQIISAVEDKRKLISWWSVEHQTLWIFGWSLVGGIIFWQIERKKYLAVAVFSSLSGLFITSYLLFVSQSIWIPVIPPLLAFLFTGVVVVFLTYQLRKI